MTQKELIRRHLETYGEITSFDAFREYGCTRVSARIYELRHEDGLIITNERKTAKNRFGEPVHYDVYRIAKEN